MIEPKDIELYQRWLRAMVRRAGDEDMEGFAAIDQLLRQAIASMPVAAELTRRRHGYSYKDLGRGLGITQQAAMKRYAGRPELGQLPVKHLTGRIAEQVTYYPPDEQREAS